MTFEEFWKSNRDRYEKLSKTNIMLAVNTACEEAWEFTDQKLLSIYKEHYNTRFAQGFKRGQESVKRKNKSGCCCIIDDNDNVVSVCGAHAEWNEVFKRDIEQPPTTETPDAP